MLAVGLAHLVRIKNDRHTFMSKSMLIYPRLPRSVQLADWVAYYPNLIVINHLHPSAVVPSMQDVLNLNFYDVYIHVCVSYVHVYIYIYAHCI